MDLNSDNSDNIPSLEDKQVKRRYQYDKTCLVKAFEAVKKGAGLRQASRDYGVPYMTLYRKVRTNDPGKSRFVAFSIRCSTTIISVSCCLH